MTPERFRQIRNLFEAALERSPEERIRFLEDAVGGDRELKDEVSRLLAAHERRVTFVDGTLTAPAELRTDPFRMEGRRVGAFEILREVGRGGMGTVYLARRADGVFEQMVAVKVVTPGSGSADVVRRFQQERAILATLDHVNIARIYDGGATEEGWPWFAMEYVDGTSVIDWCDARRLNTSDRLRLFQSVCAAVHYAHLHGVIHRDLKPGNILVNSDGVVKLLDFGIAKIVQPATQDQDTRTVLAMTPEYASPEQFRGEATTPETDIYALGVILYELLTGRRPYHLRSRILAELIRVVCEETPPAASRIVLDPLLRAAPEGKTDTVPPAVLSSAREGTPVDLKRRLSGDLDNILSKTLQKAAVDRYRSAEQLSSDLQRHLEGRPILAGKRGVFTYLSGRIGQYKLQIVLALAVVIAIASGAIRVHWTAVLYVGAGLILLGIWAAATSPRVGALIHKRLSIVGWTVAIAAIGAAIVSINWASESASIAVTRAALFVQVLHLAGLFLFICGAITWVLRRRWAGTMLFSREYSSQTVWFWILVGMRLIEVIFDPAQRSVALLAIALFAATIVYIRTILSRLEIRDRGILFRSDFRSWLQMEGFSWEGPWKGRAPTFFRALPAATQCLRVPVRRPWTFLRPFVRIPVLPADVQIVDELLKQNLRPIPTIDPQQPDQLLEIVSPAALNQEAKTSRVKRHARLAETTTALSFAVLAIAGWIYLWHTIPAPQAIHPGTLSQRTNSEHDPRFTGYLATVPSLAFSPDGRHLATGGGDSTIRVWDVATGRNLKTLKGHTATVRSVVFSPDGTLLLSGSADYSVRIWNLNRAESTHVLTGHTSHVFSIALSPDGRQLASAGSYDRSVRLWNLRNGRLIRTLTDEPSMILAVAFSRDGRWVAAGTADSSIPVWNTQTGKRFRTLTQAEKFSNSVAFSPKNFSLAAAGFDHQIRLWNVGTGQLTRTLTGHTGPVQSVTFSRDGRQLASVANNMIRLWDVPSGLTVREISASIPSLHSVAFSPDGKLVASGGYSSSKDLPPVAIWDTATGKVVHALAGHSAIITHARVVQP